MEYLVVEYHLQSSVFGLSGVEYHLAEYLTMEYQPWSPSCRVSAADYWPQSIIL